MYSLIDQHNSPYLSKKFLWLNCILKNNQFIYRVLTSNQTSKLFRLLLMLRKSDYVGLKSDKFDLHDEGQDKM